MKHSVYILLLLLFSCLNNKNDKNLIKIQTDYLQELLQKKYDLTKLLESKYYDGELRIDSISVLDQSVLAFNSLFENPKSENIIKYQEQKSYLLNNRINNIYKRDFEPNPKTFKGLKESLEISEFTFKLRLIKDFTKTLELILNQTGFLCNYGQRDFIVKYNLVEYGNKKEFLKKGFLNIENRNDVNYDIEMIYFGKLYDRGNYGYTTTDTLDFNMNVVEKHSVTHNYFPLSNLKITIPNDTLEGIIRIKINRNYYKFVPFRYTFSN